MDSARTGFAVRMGQRDGEAAVRLEGKPGDTFSEERLFACFEELGLERRLYENG